MRPQGHHRHILCAFRLPSVRISRKTVCLAWFESRHITVQANGCGFMASKKSPFPMPFRGFRGSRALSQGTRNAVSSPAKIGHTRTESCPWTHLVLRRSSSRIPRDLANDDVVRIVRGWKMAWRVLAEPCARFG